MSFGNLPGDTDDLPHINLHPVPGDRDYPDGEDTEGEDETDETDETPMCRYGADRRCLGEDCPCCEVYLEQRSEIMHGSDPSDYEPDERDDYDEEDTEPDDVDESMDGDFDSGMASAGFGTDEDYGGGDRDEGGDPFGDEW